MKVLSAIMTAILISAATRTANAQDKPLAEVTGSYQFDHLTASADGVSVSTNISRGWDGSVNFPILSWLGVVGDVGRIWKSESELLNIAGSTISTSGTSSLTTFGAGPQVTYRKGKLQPFARFIYGDAHSSSSISVNSLLGNSSGSGSIDLFFIAPGGGADFRVTHNIWLRGGADYFHVSGLNGVRAFGGITLTFGGKGRSSSQQGPSQDSLPQHKAYPGMRISALGITAAEGENAGAHIVDVEPSSVAGKAGLHPSDVITAVDGTPIRTPKELVALLASRNAGDKIRIAYLLHGQWQTEATVTLP